MTTPATARTADQLIVRMQEARTRAAEPFNVVRPEAMYDRPIPERHRIIFYLGHLESFDWNLLRRPLGLEVFHPEFDKLFSFGIDPVGGGLPDDQPKDWPSIEEIRSYNARLRSALDAGLDDAADEPNLNRLEGGRLLEVVIEHRLMHAETLGYMLHQLPFERKFPQTAPPAPAASDAAPHMVEIPAGTATLGLRRGEGELFGWDNEFDEHRVEVPAFAIDAYNVSNREFLQFMLAGGYRHREFWTDEGWAWISARNHEHPVFWERRGGLWTYRAMFEEVPLPMNWPVYVSHAEATAYARWAGKELPSEAEWHRAAYAAPDGSERAYPWGAEPPTSRRGNFDFQHWNPTPVGAYPAGASAFGVFDLLGNGWEWTRTLFAPFRGFEPFPFYRGYSADFFDGKHYVMKGGSPRTAACMLRRSFRNWFQPHYPYVYAAFRCVQR